MGGLGLPEAQLGLGRVLGGQRPQFVMQLPRRRRKSGTAMSDQTGDWRLGATASPAILR
jgi:hypothetical protein